MEQTAKSSRKTKVLTLVQEATQELLDSDSDRVSGIHAGLIAEKLQMDRANVARELNSLYRNGQLIKIQGKPTLYLCRSVLARKYPNVFFPSTLAKDGHLKDYIAAAPPVEAPTAPVRTPLPEESLETAVGATHTLKTAIQHAKAAALYPTHNLHILITGNLGVGKGHLVQKIYTYAVSQGNLGENAPLITVNCKEHSANSQLMLNQLFGHTRAAALKSEKAQRGLIERASGGILYLSEVDKLPSAAQDMLITLLEKNTYTRIGEASVTRYANTFIIATSTESPDSPGLAPLRQRFPVRIHVPDLRSWTPRELTELLIQAFRKEASSTGLSFRISRDVFSVFLKAPYPGNLGDLSSVVRTTCALAFQDMATLPHVKTMEIHLRHLPFDFLGSIQEEPKQDARIRALFQDLDLEYFIFTPTSFSSNRYIAAQLLALLHQENEPVRHPEASGSEESSCVPLLIICHGNGIAEAAAAYINDSLGQQIATGLSYPSSVPFRELQGKLLDTVRAIAAPTGVLLAADMEPLTTLHEYVMQETDIPADTVTGFTLSSLLTIAQLTCQERMTLQQLTREALLLMNSTAASPDATFLNRTARELLEPSMTFLNPYKAMDVLSSTLNGILDELDIIPSNEVTIKFIFHGSHMLERLISGDSLKYDGLKTFVNQHSHLIALLEQHMSYVGEIFGVSIPINELAYLAEIILPYL